MCRAPLSFIQYTWRVSHRRSWLSSFTVSNWDTTVICDMCDNVTEGLKEGHSGPFIISTLPDGLSVEGRLLSLWWLPQPERADSSDFHLVVLNKKKKKLWIHTCILPPLPSSGGARLLTHQRGHPRGVGQDGVVPGRHVSQRWAAGPAEDSAEGLDVEFDPGERPPTFPE